MGEPTRLFLVSLASLVLFCSVCEAAEPDGLFRPSKVHVRITNNLPGQVPLAVHCKSKKDDLGIRSIAPGTFWSFEFRPKVFARHSRHSCTFKWPGQFHSFDVYEKRRDSGRCGHQCFWSVLPEGPCLLNTREGKYDICSGWNPPSSRLPLPGSLA